MEDDADALRAARAVGGLDRELFTEAVQPLMASLLRTATAILGDEAEARDALQDALTSAWRNRGSLRDPSRWDAWLARIVLNQCRMALRQRTRRRRHQAMEPIDTTTLEPPDRADFTLRVATRDALDRAFERLSADAREVLVLRYLDDRPIAAIGRLLDIREGTVKSRLFNARKALAAAMDEVRT